MAEPFFTGYNDNFPYAYVTDRLVRGFPTWSKIRKDPNSIGAQFLNIFGLQFVEIDKFLDEALRNQNIKTANLGDVDWIYKSRPRSGTMQDLDTVESITAYSMDVTPIEIILKGENVNKECFTLLEFYSTDKSEDPFIMDFEEQLIYSKQQYSKIIADGIEFSASEPHHVWNVFDEFALLLGLRRRFLESNADLKERILDVFRFPGNSTRIGLARAIGRDLGLVFRDTWPEGQQSFQVKEYIVTDDVTPVVQRNIHIVPETFIINGQRITADQYSYDAATRTYTLYPKVKVFYNRELDYDLDRVYLGADKVLKLVDPEKEGYLTTPVIEPMNFKEWDTLTISSSGDVKVDVVRHDFETFTDQNEAYLLRDLTNGSKLAVLDETKSAYIPITEPIRLIVKLKRLKRSDQSPRLFDITVSYVPSEGEVSCIHDVGLEALHDDAFRNTLFDATGTPSTKLLNYVNILNEIVPIMWGKFKWDEAYWDVVSENLMGLHVLPNKWDPRLGEIRNYFLQTGIGYGNDCLVKFEDDSWYPKIHSGYYYISVTERVASEEGNVLRTTYPNPQFVHVRDTNKPPRDYAIKSAKKNVLVLNTESAIPVGTQFDVTFCTENYLYACPVTRTFPGPASEVMLPEGDFPMQGAPIIVTAKQDGRTVYLSQITLVAVDEATKQCTLTNINTEKIKGNGTNQIGLKYDKPIVLSISSHNIVSIDENVLTLDGPVGVDEEITVTYKIKDSFVVNIENGIVKLILSDTYTDINVTFESRDDIGYWNSEGYGPSLDPTISHITNGFVYITNQLPTPNDLDVKVHPDAIVGDGGDPALIMVDVLDKWTNPVLNSTIYYTSNVFRDDTGASVGSGGSITPTGSYYNRHVFRYLSPQYEVLPQRTDGSTKIVPCTAKIILSLIPIQDLVASGGWITVNYPDVTKLQICDSNFNICSVDTTDANGDGIPDGYDNVNGRIKLNPVPVDGQQFKAFIGEIVQIKVR